MRTPTSRALRRLIVAIDSQQKKIVLEGPAKTAFADAADLIDLRFSRVRTNPINKTVAANVFVDDALWALAFAVAFEEVS